MILTIRPSNEVKESAMKVRRYWIPALAGWLLQSFGLGLAAEETYQIEIHPGDNAIANQLNRGENRVRELFTSLPFGCMLLKLNSSAWEILELDFVPSEPEPEDGTLDPGEGAFLKSSVKFKQEFRGTRATKAQHVPFEEGWHRISHWRPEAAKFEEIVGQAPWEGVKVHRLKTGAQSTSFYDVYTFANGAWQPKEPVARVGESWLVDFTRKSDPDSVSGGSSEKTDANHSQSPPRNMEPPSPCPRTLLLGRKAPGRQPRLERNRIRRRAVSYANYNFQKPRT